MKLTSVEIHPMNSSDIAVLSFRDPRGKERYNVKSILGLDADDIVSKYYGGSGSSKFHSLSLNKRVIVAKVGLNPSFSDGMSYSDLRDSLYRIIASSRSGRIQLQFKNNNEVVAAISGFVSKLEAPNFEKLQEVQITINCDKPMLEALSPSMEYLIGSKPDVTVITDKKSTAPHGFIFEVTITEMLPSIEITDPNDDSWSFNVVPTGGFLLGDSLHFSSVYNDKYLYIVRNGITIHLADVITPGSVWPIIFPGVNIFSFTNADYIDWVSLSYYPTYWGV